MRFMIEQVKKHPLILAAAVAACLVAWVLMLGRGHQSEGKPDLQKRASNPLYTGKEPKGKASLYFAAKLKSMPESEPREIYLTASVNARARQVVQALLEGPKAENHLPVFPPQTSLRSLFLTKDGVCVVDLGPEIQKNHPGGSTGEYVSLYCLVRSLTDSLPEVQKVQVLVDGQRVSSLAGHYDLWEPLDSGSF
jgi:spore germination protein GerM